MIFPKETPSSFKTCQITKEITSCITGIWESIPMNYQEQMQPTPSSTGSFFVGTDFLHLSDKETMHSWIIFLCNFVSSLRSREFSRQCFDCLGKGKVKEAADQVVTVFSANLRDDPRNDVIKELDPLLQRQFKGCKSECPTKNQQRALTEAFMRTAWNSMVTPRKQAIEGHIILACLFKMRACECTACSGSRKIRPAKLGA